jgi:hypothetical protein
MLDKAWTTNCLQLYKDITFLHLKVLENFFVFFVVSAATFNEEQLTSFNEIPDFRAIWTTLLSPHYSTVNMPEKRFHFFSVTLRKFGTFSGNDCTLQQKRQQTVNVKQVCTINYTLIHFFSPSFKYKNRIKHISLLTYLFTWTAIGLMSEKNWFFLRNSKQFSYLLPGPEEKHNPFSHACNIAICSSKFHSFKLV